MPCLLFLDIHKTKTQHTFPKLGSRNSRASSSLAPPFSSCQQWSGPKKGWEHHHTGKSGWWQGTAGMSFLSHVLSKAHQSFSVLFSQPANFAWVAIISFTSLELLPFYQPNQTVWRQTSKIKTEGCVSLKLLHSQVAKVRRESMEWRIHLQTYMWSEGKIQNTQGTCHIKEQIIRCLIAWTTLVDIFPKNISDTIYVERFSTPGTIRESQIKTRMKWT